MFSGSYKGNPARVQHPPPAGGEGNNAAHTGGENKDKKDKKKEKGDKEHKGGGILGFFGGTSQQGKKSMSSSHPEHKKSSSAHEHPDKAPLKSPTGAPPKQDAPAQPKPAPQQAPQPEGPKKPDAPAQQPPQQPKPSETPSSPETPQQGQPPQQGSPQQGQPPQQGPPPQGQDSPSSDVGSGPSAISLGGAQPSQFIPQRPPQQGPPPQGPYGSYPTPHSGLGVMPQAFPPPFQQPQFAYGQQAQGFAPPQQFFGGFPGHSSGPTPGFPFPPQGMPQGMAPPFGFQVRVGPPMPMMMPMQMHPPQGMPPMMHHGPPPATPPQQQPQQPQQLADQMQNLDLNNSGHAPTGGQVYPGLEIEDEWKIDYSEISIEKEVARGSFGIVFKGAFRGTDVAVKKLLHQTLSKEQVEEFMGEINIMKKLHHPNVVLFIGLCNVPPNLALVTELMTGSMWNLLHDKSVVLDNKLQLKLIMDTAKGMNYLHLFKPPVLHRDLKSPNLLVDSHFNVKIADFGLARIKASLMTGNLGTCQYMAPEVIQSQNYTEKADVYSFGLVMWEVLARQVPYQGLQPMQIAFGVCQQNLRPPIPPSAPQPLVSVMVQCWQTDPAARPSFTDILNSLKGINF